LKQRVEVLEQDNRRLSEGNEVVKRDVQPAVAEESGNAKQDVTNLERELAELTIKLSQMKDAVEQRVLQRGQAALGPPETNVRMSWAEPHISGLGTAITDGSAKVDEVRREFASLTSRQWDCCPKVNQDLTNPEQELAKLKEGMRAFRVLKAAMADQ
jgi:chromosome segregation ATPase